MLIESTGNIGTMGIKNTFAEIRIELSRLTTRSSASEIPRGVHSTQGTWALTSPQREAVVRVLHTFADSAGGNFPSRLDDLPAFNRAIATKRARKKSESAVEQRENYELSMAIGRVLSFPTEFKDRYGYRADGVKLGDAGKIIFWYKPEGETKYRVVYGDLHVGDASAEELPDTKKP